MKIRKATVADVPAIAELINLHAQKGIMLPRPISRIYDNLRDYQVIEEDGRIAACSSLHITWSDLAEIRSLAVRDESQGRGYGRMLVKHHFNEAKTLKIVKVFTLTFQKEFFEKMGFREIDKSELPHKIWSECINCIHFPDCKEIAMVKYLDEMAES